MLQDYVSAWHQIELAFLAAVLHRPFDDGLPVQIRGPVDQVEGPKQDREHYPGHLIDLADAVVSLFGVGSLGFGGFELHRGAVGDGGYGGVLRQVGRVVHSGRACVVGFLR